MLRAAAIDRRGYRTTGSRREGATSRGGHRHARVTDTREAERCMRERDR
jgi:hypothetical protein